MGTDPTKLNISLMYINTYNGPRIRYPWSTEVTLKPETRISRWSLEGPSAETRNKKQYYNPGVLTINRLLFPTTCCTAKLK